MKSRLFNLFTFFALLVSVVGSALTFTPAYAAGIVVNSNADTVANDGTCTLREAITAANTNTASGAAIGECTAGAGADTITFTADYTITLLGSQLPTVTTDITINGNGAANTIIQANAAANTATYRVFEVNNTGILTLDSLTVRHGRCNGACPANLIAGGGMFSTGTLTLTNVTFSRNSAAGLGGGSGGGMWSTGTSTLTNVTFSANSAASFGGGMHSTGTSTLTDVTFSANSADYGGGMYTSGASTLTNVTFSANSAARSGGGMFSTGTLTLTNVTFSANSAGFGSGGGVYNGGSPTLTNVTFSGNSANYGGGMYTSGASTLTNVTFSANSATNSGGGMYTYGNPTLTNVTFSANSATNNGGGVYNGGSPTLTNVTFSANSATNNGGGVYNAGNPTLKNVIIANSTSGGDCVTDIGTLNAQNSLIEDGLTCVNGTNTNNLTGDPVLGALTNNGGSTQTFALLTGSPAIDTGTNTGCPATDQRGVTRPQGVGCDIGAYEVSGGIPVVTASNPSANAVLTSLSSITVVFNQDMLNNGSAQAANNTVNYILVERGTNGTFDTKSCNGGRVADDVAQNISTATYSNLVFMSTLTLANPLTNGTYRLFICGTTSIWSVAGLELNNGANDATVDFTVNSATTTGSSATSTTASSLPTTGFAPNKITSLPEQPANSAYAALGDLWLEIPSLNVKSSIVGVPQNKDNTWDVNWLGNDTGWLNGTAYPTWTGNSVLTAHVTNASGVDGPFAALKSLKYGDQVIVHMGGAKYIYEIRSTKLARPYSTSFAFESLQDHSYLTLITCSGYNPINETYLFRRIVRAVLVEVK